MKGRSIALYLAVGALCALLLMPTGAVARPAPRGRTTPPSIDQEIFEQGSNGFLISIGVHDRRRLTLSAEKPGRALSFETVSYKMPVRLRPGSDEIKARFGKLGRIAMRFHPEKVEESPPHGSLCEGGGIVSEEGFWVGLLAFHGERGYTRVRVHSALGTVTKRPPLHCHPESAAGRKRLERGREVLEKEKEEREEAGEGEEEARAPKLEATARNHHVDFVAARLAAGEGQKSFSVATLVAVGTRRRGRMEEVSGVLEALAPGSYIRPANSQDQLAEATVAPRAPFSGTGTYRTHPHGPPTWSGDLAVELPGFGDVRLAGKGTQVVACESFLTSCPGGPRSHASALLRGRFPFLPPSAARVGAVGRR